MRLCALHELDHSEGTVRLRSASSAGHKDRVLIPRPSPTDPNDPLRWPRWRKEVAFGSVCAFTFVTNFGIGGLAPAFYILSLEFDRTVAETSDLLLWPILAMGVFNFLWVPLANYGGKRAVFVFVSGLLCATTFWGAAAQSFDHLLWSNIVGGFASSASEAVGVSVVNDLFFLHERGARMGVYMNAISGGNTVGPLICGFLAASVGWRWHKYLTGILAALTFLAVLFFFPDTRFERDADQNVGIVSELGSQETVAKTEAKTEATTEAKTKAKPSKEAKKSTAESAESAELVEVPLRSSNPSETQLSVSAGSTQAEVPRKSWTQQLSLLPSVRPQTSLLHLFVRPLPMFAYPCVVYAFLCYAIALVLTVAINILNPFVLQAPPYNWSATVNGLINIPGIIGNVLGCYAGGWLVDVFCDWSVRHDKKKNGVYEPELRLYLLVLPLVVTGAGCVLFGYGVERTLHWVSLFFGFGMVSFALTAVPAITMAYVSDSLLPVNADALLLVNGCKNIVAFGFLYGIVPWVESAGYVNCFGALAGIHVGILVVGAAVLIAFGAKIRHSQSKWRIILC